MKKLFIGSWRSRIITLALVVNFSLTSTPPSAPHRLPTNQTDLNKIMLEIDSQSRWSKPSLAVDFAKNILHTLMVDHATSGINKANLMQVGFRSCFSYVFRDWELSPWNKFLYDHYLSIDFRDPSFFVNPLAELDSNFSNILSDCYCLRWNNQYIDAEPVLRTLYQGIIKKNNSTKYKWQNNMSRIKRSKGFVRKFFLKECLKTSCYYLVECVSRWLILWLRAGDFEKNVEVAIKKGFVSKNDKANLLKLHSQYLRDACRKKYADLKKDAVRVSYQRYLPAYVVKFCLQKYLNSIS